MNFANIKIPEGFEFHSPLEHHAAELARKLSGALDNAIRIFVEGIEGRQIDLFGELPSITGAEFSKRGSRVEFRCAADCEPWPFEHFFIWRADDGPHVLAWRTLSSSHVNQNTHAAMLETSLQTQALLPDEWPEPLREFLRA